ncbi:MAG: cytochrome P450 [Pseudomonadota bacterium]
MSLTTEAPSANLTRQIADIPLDQIDVSNPQYYADDTIGEYFRRLRSEAPVHYCANSAFGPYWSITRYKDIVEVDSNHRVFSSKISLGGPTLIDGRESFVRDRFMSMDPPKHDDQRKVVAPVVGPAHLSELEQVIRDRAGQILDNLPVNETFDWVDRVSIELTTQMLATLFDFPWEDRRKLTRWSNVAMAIKGSGVYETDEQREAELQECLAYFQRLWHERAKQPPKLDFISAMAHSDVMREMPPYEFLGNVILLIVGGNDTTRNSISAGVYALNKYPQEYEKLRKNPGVVPNMVSEIIRWQTPLSHMARTAVEDYQIAGKTIRKGDRVAMWYISGNRDPDAIEDPDTFVIDRPSARRHLSFGFGVHRCMGNRMAELQLKVVWEEILKRFSKIEVMGEPRRTYSNFVHGYETLPVRISKRA